MISIYFFGSSGFLSLKFRPVVAVVVAVGGVVEVG